MSKNKVTLTDGEAAIAGCMVLPKGLKGLTTAAMAIAQVYIWLLL